MRTMLALALLGVSVLTHYDRATASPVFWKACALQIGDSLTVGEASYLTRAHIVSDGVVGRQWWQGVQEAIRLRARHVIPYKVIVELGTNGGITTQDLARMRSVLRGHLVMYATNYGDRVWIPPNNRLLLQQRYVLRWDRLARTKVVVPNGGGFVSYVGMVGPDGIHPTTEGYRRLAATTAQKIGCP